MKNELVKGFKDVSGEEAMKNSQIRKIVVDTFELYGFEPAETPVIEYEDFVKGDNKNDEAVSDIFKLKDRGGRKLALRYEFTFQLKRLAKNKKLPYKRYQIGEVFRDEPISANRFRQFTQCDVDVIGAKIKNEAEILAVFSKIFREFGIKTDIKINNRKLLNEILDGQKIKNKNAVIKEIDKLDKLSESEVKQNLKKFGAEKILAIFKKPEAYFKKYKSYGEIAELKKSCKIYGIKADFQPSLARGLSYYVGSIFEIRVRGGKQKESLAGGGTYMINGNQATGISFSIERLSGLAKLKEKEKSVLVISIKQDKEVIKLAERLRDENIVCLTIFGKVSKALEYANSKKINYVIFVGEREVKSRKFKIRNMGSGKEKNLGVENLIELLK